MSHPSLLTAQDYANALLSQTACNAAGLIHSLAELMPKITAHVREAGGGTDEWNQHPIVRLYVEQLYWLANKGDNGFQRYHEASAACTQLAMQDTCDHCGTKTPAAELYENATYDDYRLFCKACLAKLVGSCPDCAEQTELGVQHGCATCTTRAGLRG